MAHLLVCSAKMAHLWTDSCILCYTCVHTCVWLSAKMAHLLACFVKMEHLWTDGCILCCMRVYLYACVCVCLCVAER